MPHLYDESGYVSDWGLPNINHLTVDGYVAAWKTWQVIIWWKRSSEHWHEHLTFYVERFQNIQHHYNKYFHCQIPQYTHDRIFVVECCIWSSLNGWEYTTICSTPLCRVRRGIHSSATIAWDLFQRKHFSIKDLHSCRISCSITGVEGHSSESRHDLFIPFHLSMRKRSSIKDV